MQQVAAVLIKLGFRHGCQSNAGEQVEHELFSSIQEGVEQARAIEFLLRKIDGGFSAAMLGETIVMQEAAEEAGFQKLGQAAEAMGLAGAGELFLSQAGTEERKKERKAGSSCLISHLLRCSHQPALASSQSDSSVM